MNKVTYVNFQTKESSIEQVKAINTIEGKAIKARIREIGSLLEQCDGDRDQDVSDSLVAELDTIMTRLRQGIGIASARGES